MDQVHSPFPWNLLEYMETPLPEGMTKDFEIHAHLLCEMDTEEFIPGPGAIKYANPNEAGEDSTIGLGMEVKILEDTAPNEAGKDSEQVAALPPPGGSEAWQFPPDNIGGPPKHPSNEESLDSIFEDTPPKLPHAHSKYYREKLAVHVQYWEEVAIGSYARHRSGF